MCQNKQKNKNLPSVGDDMSHLTNKQFDTSMKPEFTFTVFFTSINAFFQLQIQIVDFSKN